LTYFVSPVLILADEKASSVSSALDDNAFLFGLAGPNDVVDGGGGATEKKDEKEAEDEEGRLPDDEASLFYDFGELPNPDIPGKTLTVHSRVLKH
jgi:hypothetical protein